MKVHLWTCTRSWELHISPLYKTSGQQTTWKSVRQDSSKDVQKQQQDQDQDQDPFLQHESHTADLGADPAGGGDGSTPAAVPRPPWHGLGQWVPPGLQLPVPPRRGAGGHQELLQPAGRLGPPVDIRMSAHARGPGGGQRLLVGRHQPCRDGVVGADSFLQYGIIHELLAKKKRKLHWSRAFVVFYHTDVIIADFFNLSCRNSTIGHLK